LEKVKKAYKQSNNDRKKETGYGGIFLIKITRYLSNMISKFCENVHKVLEHLRTFLDNCQIKWGKNNRKCHLLHITTRHFHQNLYILTFSHVHVC
jgi:hypothetical protein